MLTTVCANLNDGHPQEGDIVKSSGYVLADFKDLVVTLNKMLHARPIPQLLTVRSKYSHK